ILKEKRSRAYLNGIVATLDEFGMLLRIAHIDSHHFIPGIGDRNQMRIDCCAEFAQKIGERIAEILVFAAPETMPLHDDATTKDVIMRIKTGDGPAFPRGKKLFHRGVALLIQISCDSLPVEPVYPLDCGFQ